jgi:hypothetical protein
MKNLKVISVRLRFKPGTSRIQGQLASLQSEEKHNRLRTVRSPAEILTNTGIMSSNPTRDTDVCVISMCR